jgi:hypothetical protein
MSELRDKRALFTKLICRLINEMIFKGYTPCFGKDGLKHMEGSLHYEGLAKDIDLYKGDKYLDKTEDHAEFGKIWESYNPLCRWGGRFKDGNHYSVTYQNRS